MFLKTSVHFSLLTKKFLWSNLPTRCGQLITIILTTLVWVSVPITWKGMSMEKTNPFTQCETKPLPNDHIRSEKVTPIQCFQCSLVDVIYLPIFSFLGKEVMAYTELKSYIRQGYLKNSFFCSSFPDLIYESDWVRDFEF